MRNLKHIILSLLAIISVAPATADDFGLWSEAGLTKKLGNQGFSFSADLGFRANNNLKSVDRWSATVGFDFKACPYFKMGAGYSLLYYYNGGDTTIWRNKTNPEIIKGYKVSEAYWRPKHRIFIDMTGSAYWGRFTFSLRERYQMTHQTAMTVDRIEYRTDANGNLVSFEPDADRKHQKSKNYLRSKLEVEYNIRKCPLTPYASYELSNNLMNGFSTDKQRVSIGSEIKLSKKHRLSLGYVYQFGEDDEDDTDAHVINVSYKFKF